jgi:uncharacterized integral membrane protein
MLESAHGPLILRAVITGALFGAAFAALFPWLVERLLSRFDDASIELVCLPSPGLRLGLLLASGGLMGFFSLLEVAGREAETPLIVGISLAALAGLTLVGILLVAHAPRPARQGRDGPRPAPDRPSGRR